MSSLAELVEGVLRLDPAAEAIEFKQEWWTWGDIDGVGRALDALLNEAGLGPAARVAGVMHNYPQVAALLLRVICSARCIVTLNPHLPADRLVADILRLKPPVVVASPGDWERATLREAVAQIGALGISLPASRGEVPRLVEGLDRVRGTDLNVTAEAGVAIEMLTSGTTGEPKRIPLKLKTLERAVMDAGVYDNREEGGPRLRSGVGIFNAPFAHIAGVFRLFNNVVAGRKLALLERFSVGEFVGAVRRYRPKVAAAPPSALRMILDADVPKEDLESLRAFRTSTAPLDPDLADEFSARYGVPVLQNYSATEFAGAGAGWTLKDYHKFNKSKRGSVGRVNPGIKARIVDAESGDELPLGEQGLLEIKAPHLGDGVCWLRTTDLAVMDGDDFLWIKGRADNAIIRGGFKIIPDDIVRAVERHPAVLEAAVVGLSDPRLGMVPAAAYIVRSGVPAPSEEELRDFLRHELLPYQVPVRLLVVAELPRTPSLKVSQPQLKAMFLDQPGQPGA